MPPLTLRPNAVILFLDIDGVLNTSGTYKRWRDLGGCLSTNRHHRLDALFEPRCVQSVNTLIGLIENHGGGRVVQIVISSSWREEHTLDELRDLLDQAGIDRAHERIIDRTPSSSWEIRWRGQDPEDTRHAVDRGADIADWINQNTEIKTHEELNRRVLILEDEADVWPFQGRQVKTAFYGTRAGFGPRHVRTAMRLLGLEDVCASAKDLHRVL